MAELDVPVPTFGIATSSPLRPTPPPIQPAPPQLTNKPSTGSDSPVAPPPLQRMMSPADQDEPDIDESSSDVSGISSSASSLRVSPHTIPGPDAAKKTSNLDSLLGKIKANKSMENTNHSNNEPAVPPPPSLKRCADMPPAGPERSRRKQAMPKAAADERTVKVEPEVAAAPKPDSFSTIDSLLMDSVEIVKPVEAPNDQLIDIASGEEEEGDEDYHAVRISSKGRVVKRPSWSHAYTDHSTEGETEDDPEYIMPERPHKTDNFAPREHPKFEAGTQIKQQDLPNNMRMEPRPQWILAFKRGWMRELVIRNPPSNDETLKTNADAYYYAPKQYGSCKLRSVVKVEEFLKEMNVPELTGNNFTFQKRAIYQTPEEFVRMAGKIGSSNRPRKSPQKSHKPIINKLVKGHGPASLTSTPLKRDGLKPIIPMRQIVQSSSGMIYKSPLLPSQKIKASADAVVRAREYIDYMNKNRSETGKTNSAIVKIIGPAGKPPSSLQKVIPPCSSHCPGVQGQPSLQCGVCLVLYHTQCVNWAPSTVDSLFVCSKCILRACQPPNKKSSESYKIVLADGKTVSVLGNRPIIPSREITNSNNNNSVTSPASNGRYIIIPDSLLSKIDKKSPFALKLNTATYRIDPKKLQQTPQGMRVLITDECIMKPEDAQKCFTDKSKQPPANKGKSPLELYKALCNVYTQKKLESGSLDKNTSVTSDVQEVLTFMMQSIEFGHQKQLERDEEERRQQMNLNKPRQQDSRHLYSKVPSLSEVIYEPTNAGISMKHINIQPKVITSAGTPVPKPSVGVVVSHNTNNHTYSKNHQNVVQIKPNTFHVVQPTPLPANHHNQPRRLLATTNVTPSKPPVIITTQKNATSVGKIIRLTSVPNSQPKVINLTSTNKPAFTTTSMGVPVVPISHNNMVSPQYVVRTISPHLPTAIIRAPPSRPRVQLVSNARSFPPSPRIITSCPSAVGSMRIVQSLSQISSTVKPISVMPMNSPPIIMRPKITSPLITRPHVVRPQITSPPITQPRITSPPMTRPQITYTERQKYTALNRDVPYIVTPVISAKEPEQPEQPSPPQLRKRHKISQTDGLPLSLEHQLSRPLLSFSSDMFTVLELLFGGRGYLNRQDVMSCSRVCKLWRLVARDSLQHRVLYDVEIDINQDLDYMSDHSSDELNLVIAEEHSVEQLSQINLSPGLELIEGAPEHSSDEAPEHSSDEANEHYSDEETPEPPPESETPDTEDDYDPPDDPEYQASSLSEESDLEESIDGRLKTAHKMAELATFRQRNRVSRKPEPARRQEVRVVSSILKSVKTERSAGGQTDGNWIRILPGPAPNPSKPGEPSNLRLTLRKPGSQHLNIESPQTITQQVLGAPFKSLIKTSFGDKFPLAKTSISNSTGRVPVVTKDSSGIADSIRLSEDTPVAEDACAAENTPEKIDGSAGDNDTQTTEYVDIIGHNSLNENSSDMVPTTGTEGTTSSLDILTSKDTSPKEDNRAENSLEVENPNGVEVTADTSISRQSSGSEGPPVTEDGISAEAVDAEKADDKSDTLAESDKLGDEATEMDPS